MAVVIGLCSHGLAVARALSRSGIRVFAVEKDMQLPGVRSSAVQRVHRVADFGADELVSGLLALRKKLAGDEPVVLFPINDNHVRVIGENWAALAPHFKLSWAGSVDTVLTLQRKDELESFTRQRGLNYPASLVCTEASASASAAVVAGLRFPVIIKPVRPLSGFKALLARDRAQLQDLLCTHQADLPILAQEFIAGDDTSLYFVSVMMRAGEVLHAAVGHKLASFPPAMGQTTVAETDATYHDELLALTRRFFAGTGISGPVSLEFKRDAQGRFWVIEPTVGRTDFWAGLFIRAGFCRPLMEFQLATGQEVGGPAEIRGTVWYDTERAPLAYMDMMCRTWSLRPLGKLQAFSYLDMKDWGPFVSGCLALLRGLARRLFGLLRKRRQGVDAAPV